MIQFRSFKRKPNKKNVSSTKNGKKGQQHIIGLMCSNVLRYLLFKRTKNKKKVKKSSSTIIRDQNKIHSKYEMKRAKKNQGIKYETYIDRSYYGLLSLFWWVCSLPFHAD